MNQQKQTTQKQLQQQQQKRRSTTNTTTGRKRTNSSCSSSSSSGSPTNAFSSDPSLSTTTKSNQPKKKKSSNRIDTDTDSSSASQIPSNSSDSFTPPSAIPPRFTAQRSVPAFLNKLYNMVEDFATSDLIRWSKGGTSFIVEKHEEFAKTVLPRFYKHNTFASFVRQLNMYDFHKVPHLQQGVLIAETEHEIWEFSNPHFQRGRPDLLVLVTRKRNRDRDTVDTENVSLSTLAQDLSVIKKHQSAIDTDIRDLQRDNEILWQETLSAREKYQKQQEVIEKILQFLTAIFVNDSLAITMNNADLLPKGLIEEAASLAGMSTKLEDINKIKSTTALPSNLNSSTLSNIISSVLRLYSANPLSMQQTDATQSVVNRNDSRHASTSSSSDSYYPQSPQELNQELSNLSDKSPTITEFSNTLNTATRSAQNISQDIDMLQVNIESLANNLGLDPRQFDEEMESDRCFQDNLSNMVEPTSNLADVSKLYTRTSNIQMDKKTYGQQLQQQQQQQLRQNMANMINNSDQYTFHLQSPPTGQYRHPSQIATGNSHHSTLQPQLRTQYAHQTHIQQPLRTESKQDRKLSYSATPQGYDNNANVKQQKPSDGTYRRFLAHMDYNTDSFGPNYSDDGGAAETSADYQHATSDISNRFQPLRTNSLPIYYSTTAPTTEGLMTPTNANDNNADNYAAMVNSYSDMMRPPYYHGMHDTNSGENYDDNT